jgi:uncharacterized membrane protein HdeD (DUF308 family)
MRSVHSGDWWTIALRGLVALLYGVLVFVWPAISLLALVYLFGAYALIDGVFAITASVHAARGQRKWWPLALAGIAGVAAGVLTFAWPGITALTLLYFIAFWAIAIGIACIAQAIQLRKEIEGEWLLGSGGVLAIFFGLIFIIFPGAGAFTVIWLIGAFATAFGIVMLTLAFRLYQRQSRVDERSTAKPTMPS